MVSRENLGPRIHMIVVYFSLLWGGGSHHITNEKQKCIFCLSKASTDIQKREHFSTSPDFDRVPEDSGQRGIGTHMH